MVTTGGSIAAAGHAGPSTVRAREHAALPAWMALGAFFLFVHGVNALYWLLNAPTPAGFHALAGVLWVFLMWKWLDRQCRPQRQTYPLDMGLFLGMIGFLLVPYYMWSNQGWKGLLKIGAVVAMWIVAWVLTTGAAWLTALMAAD